MNRCIGYALLNQGLRTYTGSFVVCTVCWMPFFTSALYLSQKVLKDSWMRVLSP